MALQSKILSGNTRLDSAASGGPSIKPAPPPDDPDAVKRIQKALAELKFPLPLSFPAGPTNEPDGKFGQETYTQVIAFQKVVFPKDPSQWDGRVGKNTLREMDLRLPKGSSPTPSSTLTVIPFHETRPMLISFEDHTKLSQNLEDKPVVLTRLKPIALLNLVTNRLIFDTVSKRERQFLLEMRLGGVVANILAIDFLANILSGREILYDTSNLVSTTVHSSSEFKKAHSNVAAFIADALTRGLSPESLIITSWTRYRKCTPTEAKLRDPNASADSVRIDAGRKDLAGRFRGEKHHQRLSSVAHL